MLRSSSSSSTAASVHTPPEDSSDGSDNESVDYGPVSFTPPAPDRSARPNYIMRSPLLNVATLVQNYINILRPTTRSHRADWTLYVSRSAQLTDKPTAVPIVAIFSWHYRGRSRQLSYARSDIANGESELMHVLYRIGQNNYHARCTIPEYRGYWEPSEFMTFSPSGPPYIPEGYPGSYISTTPDLSTFGHNIVDIDCMTSGNFDDNLIQLLYLALIFDFLAFTAQTP